MFWLHNSVEIQCNAGSRYRRIGIKVAVVSESGLKSKML